MSLVVAVQFCQADRYRTARLLDLMCRLGTRRDDVAVMLVRTDEFSLAGPVAEAAARCAEIFQVADVIVRRDAGPGSARLGWRSRWDLGCAAVWEGAADYFIRVMHPRWSTIFFVDGGNGVPLHRDWIGLVLADHERTLEAGRLVTGSVFRDPSGRSRLSANLVVEWHLFQFAPYILTEVEPEETWGSYYESLIAPHTRASSLVRYDQGLVAPTPEMFARAAETSAWWHGCRSGNFVDLAREHLLAAGEYPGAVGGGPAPRCPGPAPTILDLGPATDLLAGGDYRGAGARS